eukprot:TRINITY_DN4480_c0_g1_i5.p1 TRINITY_DN4480_c0_g1~~TRINITY_DN4480_c0_g1_i5.p1  ORF type:complete len:110 (-),score=14.79 TRINITY_DN4480_c0_g1_i5:104-433(-)
MYVGCPRAPNLSLLEVSKLLALLIPHALEPELETDSLELELLQELGLLCSDYLALDAEIIIPLHNNHPILESGGEPEPAELRLHAPCRPVYGSSPVSYTHLTLPTKRIV